MKGVYLVICLIVCMKLICGEKGPYVTTMTSVVPCPKTTLPMMTRNPGFVFDIKLVNTTKKTNLIVGNITVTRTIKNIVGTAVAYKWENGKWKTHMSLPKLACSTPISVTVIAIMTNLKIDPVECVFMKGTYRLEFDINVADHIWAPVREYGRVRWKLEFLTKRNTISCFYAESIVEPLKNVNKTDA